jgi:hypothetical protein
VLGHENYNRRCQELSNPEGLANLVVSFVFQTGSAMLAIERFRRACPDKEIPSHFTLSAIPHMLQSCVLGVREVSGGSPEVDSHTV